MKRLINIQQKLKSPKGNTNKFGGFKYRKASDILECVKPLLAAEKVAIVMNDDIESIDNNLFLKSVVLLYGEDGEVITTSAAYAMLDEHKGMSAEQATGAASSYARKYALCGLLAIDDSSNDPDTIEQKPTTLQEGLEQIAKCNTVEDLKKVWLDNNHLQKEIEFESAKDTRKKVLTNKQAQQ